jgi:5-deoxy-glucuronate isomerase
MKHTSLHQFSYEPGFERVITGDNSQLKHLNFSRIILQKGGALEYAVGEEEMVLVLQEGDFTADVDSAKGKLSNLSGQRSSVYDELPAAIYLPPGSRLSLESKNGMEARIFSAPCEDGNAPCFIGPQDIKEGTPGVLNWKRKYRFICSPASQVTKKLIVGESVSVPGGWIGFPAHKHDVTNDTEYPLDEVFSFRIKGPHGAYVIQHSYDLEEGWDEYHTVKANNMAIALSKGYHTSMVVPGCTYYLLWGLAGESKNYKLTYDSRFAWLSDSEWLYPNF